MRNSWATMRWGGRYRFTPIQYIQWLSTWRPQWAAAMDLCCLSESGEYPGAAVVEARQRWTTEMAWRFWQRFRDVPWCWVPTIQGYHRADFERHAGDLAPLIRQMQAYYTDPGWWNDDDEEGQFGSMFRVGVGSLCGRASPGFLLEVIACVQAIIGRDIPLHLWGVKLKTLQAGIALPGVISCDSGAWNGLFGREHEKRRESGLTVVEYSWQRKYPDYAHKVIQAQQQPQQLALDLSSHPDRCHSFPSSWQLVEQLTAFD